MTGKVVQLKLYTLVIGILIAVASPLGSLFAAVQIAENNAKQMVRDQEKAQAEAKAQAQAEIRRVTCEYFALDLDTYLEAPPSTKTGVARQRNALDFYRVTGCQPPRTK